MPLGKGYWLNRRTSRLLEIDDHANDACSNPQRFNLTSEDLIKALMTENIIPHTNNGHIAVRNEDERTLIIKRVCVAGFIRIRDYKARLGWQFAGDPPSALWELRRYGQRRQLGPLYEVTFSDFGLDTTVTGYYVDFTKDAESAAVKNLIDTWIKRYEVS